MSNEAKDYEYDKRQHILSQLDRDGGLPKGWYKELVPNMIEELVKVLGPYVFDFEVLQCKEKYGSIRCYYNITNQQYKINEVSAWDLTCILISVGSQLRPKTADVNMQSAKKCAIGANSGIY